MRPQELGGGGQGFTSETSEVFQTPACCWCRRDPFALGISRSGSGCEWLAGAGTRVDVWRRQVTAGSVTGADCLGRAGGSGPEKGGWDWIW